MISTSSHLKYGQALYQVAEKQHIEEQILNELGELAHLLDHQEFKNLMTQMMFMNQEEQSKVIDATFGGKIHDTALNLLKILLNNKKILLLSKVYETYRRLFHEKHGIADVIVRTARALSAEEEKVLIQKLEEKKKQKVSARFEVQKDLISGFQIYEKGQLTDYSTKNYLESLRHYLLRQTSPLT